MLRFYYVVITGMIKMLYMVRQAKYYDRHREKFDAEFRYRHVQKMTNFLRRRAHTETTLFGEENLPKEGGYIMYSNHQGKYDAIGFLSYFKEPCSVLIEIKSSMVLSTKQAIDLIDGIRIDQTKPRQQVKALRQLGEDVRDNGRKYLVFPEGKWGKNRNTLQEFHNGCFYSAGIAKCPLVPVVLVDSWKSMNTNNLFGKVKTEIHFLPPLLYEDYENLSREELCEKMKDIIQTEMTRILSEKATLSK